ncbi:MAG TPA: hypothetical protein VKF62_06975, partial [Planctomycetota bacterium]|nr:hypothetical protein [Planctomycetota bacterium]
MRIPPLAFALLILSFAPSLAPAQFSEVEPNDDKSTATFVNGLVPLTGTITGTTTGSAVGGGTNSVDYFRIRIAPAAVPGIYRHMLLVDPPAFSFLPPPYTFSILGLSQTGSFSVGGTILATEAVV